MGRRRYRILHLITRLELGGAQQNTLFCVEHHDRRRFEVELIAGRGGRLDPVAERIPDARVQVVPWLGRPVAPARDLVALLRLRSCFRERRIDLVHTHSSKAGVLGRWAAWLAGVPFIVHTVHGWSFNPTQAAWRRGVYAGIERATAPLTDRLIAVAHGNRDLGLARGIGHAAQYAVVRSGIDVRRYAASNGQARDSIRRALGYRDDHVVVGTLCCLKPQKAPLDFVRAAAAAVRRDDRLRFFLAGDGELRPQVERLAAELDLGDRLRVLGWRDDVPELMRAMDIFLLTSLFEGLPRAVLEAMASGVPVVATAVDGTPEVVEHGRTGLLVPPGQPERAAEGVLRLAADRAFGAECARRGRTRIDERFDIRGMVRDLERIYLSLLEGRR